MRIAEVAIDEERPDAEHGQRLRKIDRERGLALAVERGGDLHDLHRLRPHRPLQSKANGPDRFGEECAGFVDRVARQRRLQRRRQQLRVLRIVTAEFVASAPGETGQLARADQRDSGQRRYARNGFGLFERLDAAVEIVGKERQHAARAETEHQRKTEDEHRLGRGRPDRNAGLGDDPGIRHLQALLRRRFLGTCQIGFILRTIGLGLALQFAQAHLRLP